MGELWRGTREQFIDGAIRTGTGLGLFVATGILIGGIYVAKDKIRHNRAVNDAEELAEFSEHFADTPSVQLDFLGDFPSIAAVSPEVNAFATVQDTTSTEDKYKKTLYVITADEYQELPEYENDGKSGKFAFLDFPDDVRFYEDFDFEFRALKTGDVFNQASEAVANKQVLEVVVTTGGFGMDDSSVDTLLSGGFRILYTEGVESYAFGDSLGVPEVHDGTQRVYTVPPFTV